MVVLKNSADITDLAVQGDIQLRYRPGSKFDGKKYEWVLFVDISGGGFRGR